MTFADFLRDAEKAGIIDFSLRIVRAPQGQMDFYIYPHGRDGETGDFEVHGNIASPIPNGLGAGSDRPPVEPMDPDWWMCAIDPDEAGETAYEAMHPYRPRLAPIELFTSYRGPTKWGVMIPPDPDGTDDEETARVFDTREEAEAFCARALTGGNDRG